MIRVAYIVPMLAPYADVRYQELAKNPDLEIHVISELDTSESRKGWRFHDIPGIHTHLVEKRVSKKYKMKNKKDGYVMQKGRDISIGLRKIVRKINPDILLVCNSTQILLLLGPRKYKLGVIVEDTLRAEESRSVINRIFKRLMLKTADFYCPFTSDAELFLEANGINGPFIKSSWSMDISFFSDLNREEKQAKKAELNLSNCTNYILVSSLIPRKGVKQFIIGWSKMPKTFQKKSELYIVGEGELKDELISLVESKKMTNVHILGNKPYQEVSYYLQCGDVFVLPTLEDLCSLAVLEAMASKMPVLTTIYNGAREFVEEGKNGYIFDPTSEVSIVETLKKMSESDLTLMSNASAEKIELYSTKKVMNEFGRNLIRYYEKYN